MRKASWIAAWLAAGIFLEVEGASGPERPSPEHRAYSAGARPILSWHAGLDMTTNLLSNGGFEQGAQGWTLPPSAQIERYSANPTEGTNVLSVVSGAFERTVALPLTDSPILWTFSHLRTHPFFGPVTRVLSASGQLLRLAGIEQGLPATNRTWTVNTLDLSEFAGQTVRLVIEVANNAASPHRFDDFRVVVLPAGLEFDLYFNGYKGRFQSASWQVEQPLLRGGTYGWRVDSIYNGVTNKGPVWNFVTWVGQVEPGGGTPLFEPIPNRVCPGEPVPLTVRYIESYGFTTFNSGQTLSFIGATADDAVEPGILISEVDTGEIDGVEIINVSTNTIDLSGWTLELINGGPQLRVELPPQGAVLQPGEIFIARENEPDDAWPRLRLSGIDWADLLDLDGGVLLRDQSSNIVDCLFFDVNILSAWGPQKLGASITDWPDSPITNRPPAQATFQRHGQRDTNLRNDWSVGPSSMNALNSSLSLPFARGYGKLDVIFNVITNKPGEVLIGEARFAHPATNVTVFARSLPHHVYTANYRLPFQVVPPTHCLKLFAPSQIDESADKVPVKITLGGAASHDFVVNLRLWESNHVEYVTNIVFPAGQSELDLDLRSLNNSLLENTRTFFLTASALEYASDRVTVKILDDETPTLTLTAAVTPIREGMADLIFESSRAPARNMLVSIAFDPPFWTRYITLRAGITQLAIDLPDDASIQGDGPMTVRARMENGPTVTNTFPFVDNEDKSVRVTTSAEVLREGRVHEATVKLGGWTTKPIDISLVSTRPDLVQPPATVRAEKEVSEIKFTLLCPTNDLAPGIYTAELIASAAGLVTTTNLLRVEAGILPLTLKAEFIDGAVQISFEAETGWEYRPVSATEFNGTWQMEPPLNFNGPGRRILFGIPPAEPRRLFIIRGEAIVPQ